MRERLVAMVIKRIKKNKNLPKSGRKDEIRRPDELADELNDKIIKPFKNAERLGKFFKIASTVITVAIAVYGLIPKEDKLPGVDNQRYEIMSE